VSGKYTDENQNYQIDLSQTQYSSGSLHEIYKDIGNVLNDVDWIAETEDRMILIEFTHYEKREHLPKGDSAEAKRLQIAKKFYGGIFFLLACGKRKPVDFIWIAESQFLDKRVRGHYMEAMTKWLPYRLQDRSEVISNLITQFHIFSVDDWNKAYPQFPLIRIEKGDIS